MKLSQRALSYGGAIAVTIGLLVAFIGSRVESQSELQNQLVAASAGDPLWENAGGSGQGFLLMWFGIIVAVIGAVVVLRWLSTRKQH